MRTSLGPRSAAARGRARQWTSRNRKGPAAGAGHVGRGADEARFAVVKTELKPTQSGFIVLLAR